MQMASEMFPAADGLLVTTTRAEIETALSQPSGSAGILQIDTVGLKAVALPEGVVFTKPFIVGQDVLLLQPDGTLFALIDGMSSSLLINSNGFIFPIKNLREAAAPDGSWELLADIPEIDIPLVMRGVVVNDNSGVEHFVFPGAPLVGLPISPLLPPTEYAFPKYEEEEYFGGKTGLPTANLNIELTGPATESETDAPLTIVLSDYVSITAGYAEFGEEVTEVRLTLTDLPMGTLSTDGALVVADNGTLTLNFTGSLDAFNAMSITFPTDFSTQNRTDIASGDLSGTVTAVSNFLGETSFVFPVTIRAEGDAEIDISQPDNVPDETDSATEILPVDLLRPEVTDQDGSEELVQLVLRITGLPADSDLTSLQITLPDGAIGEFNSASDGSSTFTLTLESVAVGDVLAAYEAFALTLPADFSTANRPI
jgi:large repetitive protein